MIKKRILIIDDEINILKSLTRALDEEYEIETALGASAAIKLLDKGNAHFDVILSDFMMPDTTGEGFYLYVSKHYPELEKRIIYMTGGKYTANIQKFFDTHYNICLAKPFSQEDLLLAIERVLQQ